MRFTSTPHARPQFFLRARGVLKIPPNLDESMRVGGSMKSSPQRHNEFFNEPNPDPFSCSRAGGRQPRRLHRAAPATHALPSAAAGLARRTAADARTTDALWL
jgi:hypothetical protein